MACGSAWFGRAIRATATIAAARSIWRGSHRWPEPGEIVVTNYEILPPAEDLGATPARVYLVADEAHALKSHKALRTRRFRAMSDSVRQWGGSVWVLTGTPLLSRPPDLWGVLASAGLEHPCFGSFERFADMFGASKRQVARGRWAYDWSSSRPSPEVPGRLRAVSLRRERRDVLADLPPKRVEVLTETDLAGSDGRVVEEVWRRVEAAGVDDEHLPSFAGMSEARAALAAAKAGLLAVRREHDQRLLALLVLLDELERINHVPF